MQLSLGKVDENASRSVSIYQQKYSIRRVSYAKTFLAVDRRIRKNATVISTTVNWGAPVRRNPELEEQIIAA